jgi:cytochrome c heme-lyase
MGNSSSTPNREGGGSIAAPRIPTAPEAKTTASEAEVCPVDHKSREAWLQHARKTGERPPHPMPPIAPPIPVGESCDPPQVDQRQSPKSPSAIQTLLQATGRVPLATEREVSTIPRALPSNPDNSRPANNEVESGRDKSGKWIYPSEQMFFEAMRRKKHDPKAEDMRTIVPIHNAVNERAWGEILAWEKGKGGEG